jgi:RNA polymerase sigma factor (sigma-70 family)
MLSTPARPRRFVRSDPDERLVSLVRAGQTAAFEELYDRYTPGLLSYCRHLLGSLDEAEDAVQHTFLAAHRALLRDDREIHLKAWLYAIARNRCLSMLRARRERVGFDDEIEALPSTAGLAVEVEQREDLRDLLGDLQRLPEDQRSALVLSELGAHSHDEIGEVLGVKKAKVKALVFQARESLAAARTARETPCGEIREELATARGGALRRGNLRRHLEACAGCRAFRDDVAHQRAAFSVLLPVVPSLALKQAVLGGAAITAGGGAAVAGGAAMTAGGAAAGAGGKAATAKLLTVVVAAGGASGGGYVAIHETTKGHGVPNATAASTPLPQHASAHEVTGQATPLPPRAATPPTPPATSSGHVVFASNKTRLPRKKAKRHHARARDHAAPAADVIFAVEKTPLPEKPEKGHKDHKPAKAEKPGHGPKPKKDKKPKKPKKDHVKGKGHEHKQQAPPPPPSEENSAPPPPPAQTTTTSTATPVLVVKQKHAGAKNGHFKHLHKDGPGRKVGHVEFQNAKPNAQPAAKPQKPAKAPDEKGDVKKAPSVKDLLGG